MAKRGRPLGQETIGDRLQRSVKVNDKGCWIWQLSVNKLGYGLMRVGKKMRTPHRVNYEYYKGEIIPVDMCVCHTCDNPTCINPDHLWIGTRKDNTKDMESKGRHKYWGVKDPKGIPRPRTHCKHCGVEGAINSIGRFHNNNCKQKPI